MLLSRLSRLSRSAEGYSGNDVSSEFKDGKVLLLGCISPERSA